MSDRAKIDFAAALGDLDDFNTPAAAPKPAPRSSTAKVSQAVAENAGFRRREPVQPASSRQQRRRRTGRTHQLNVKIRPEFAERLYHIADSNGWGVGETFEKAIEFLEREMDPA